jgi:hypothetical protein
MQKTNTSDLLDTKQDQATYTTHDGNVVTGPVSYVFLVALQENNPELYNKVPNLFKRQLTEQAYNRPFVDSSILGDNQIRVALEDPKLLYNEDIPSFFNEEFILEFLSRGEDDKKYMELMRTIPEHFDSFRGVTVKLHLTGILDDEGELVPQESNKKGSLPMGQSWLSGLRSNQLRLDEKAVEHELITLADYKALHYYAAFAHVLISAEGDRALYNKSHTNRRIWFAPANKQARVEFDFISRNTPGTLEEAVGLTEISWANVRGLGIFCGTNSQITDVSAPVGGRANAPRPALPLRAKPAGVPAEATFGQKRAKTAPFM